MMKPTYLVPRPASIQDYVGPYWVDCHYFVRNQCVTDTVLVISDGGGN